MDECLIRVGKTRNGWEVECLDPAISADNQKPKISWRDPWVTYAFEKKEQLVEFLEEALDIVKPRRSQESDAFEAAFKEAVKDADKPETTED